MIAEFWDRFLAASGRDSATVYREVFHFELNQKLADELLELVLAGKKRATASSLWAFQVQSQPVPKVGELSVITDWSGTPYCVIETTAVTILPFNEMTTEICLREGEDDCLQSWQYGHEKFFRAESKQLGYTFSPDMPVVFEDFRVVYQEPRE